jgi:hypothetical protein
MPSTRKYKSILYIKKIPPSRENKEKCIYRGDEGGGGGGGCRSSQILSLNQ